MKFKLTREKLAAGDRTEWSVEVERGVSRTDDFRFAAEDRERYYAALRAIRAAPSMAEEIIEEVIG